MVNSNLYKSNPKNNKKISESFKNLFTTSACAQPKGFSNCKSIVTYQYNEDKQWLPSYKNTASLFLTNTQYAQIGIGTTHCMRGAFVVDSDTNATVDELHYIYSQVFVEPTVILYNPKSNHTQIFWFFTKDIRIGTFRNNIMVKNKTAAKYMKYTHKLNKFLNLGDEHFTGYWVKNPWNKNFIACHQSNETYDFNTLCALIDMLDDKADILDKINKKKYVEDKVYEYNRDELVKEAIDEETEVVRIYNEEHTRSTKPISYTDQSTSFFSSLLSYIIPFFYNIFSFHTIEHTDHDSNVIDNEAIEDIAKSETKAKVSIERRGKYKQGSENRHSTLFHMLKTQVMLMGKIDKDYLRQYAYTMNNIFDKPLTKQELDAEVLNNTTLDKTFHTLLKWKNYREYVSEKAQDYALDVFEECNEDKEQTKEELRIRGWTNYMIAKVFNEDIKEAKKEDQKKYKGKYDGKYKGKYDGKYKGKYDETEYVRRNKVATKVRNWLKRNGSNKEYPKKWNEEEIAIANQLKK